MRTATGLARGDVVLVNFPFTDLSGQKLRPGLVIGRPSGDDLIIAFVTSRAQRPATPAEYLLDASDPEFSASGLKVSALIRLDKIATLHRSLALRRLGRIGLLTDTGVANALRFVFDL